MGIMRLNLPAKSSAIISLFLAFLCALYFVAVDHEVDHVEWCTTKAITSTKPGNVGETFVIKNDRFILLESEDTSSFEIFYIPVPKEKISSGLPPVVDLGVRFCKDRKKSLVLDYLLYAFTMFFVLFVVLLPLFLIGRVLIQSAFSFLKK